MNRILIIGCGLIGSSVLRAVHKKKVAKKIFILEKSKNNISKIKRLNLQCQIIKDFKNEIPKMDMIIFCTHLSNYEEALKKINKFLNKNPKGGIHHICLEVDDIKKIKEKIETNGVNILGPVLAPISKLKRKYRCRILIRYPKNLFIQKYLSHSLNKIKIASGIKLEVDVDPINFS